MRAHAPRTDALRYLVSYQDAIKYIAKGDHKTGDCALNYGISINLSALHPRCEDAQHIRVMAELGPRVRGLCELAEQAI